MRGDLSTGFCNKNGSIIVFILPFRYNQLMKWNTSQWDNISSLMVYPSDVWIPDIVLYNNGEPGLAGGLDVYRTPIEMNSDGLHYWLSPAMFTSTCKINVKFFPFDDQHCELKFGSWMHDVEKIMVQMDDRDVLSSTFVPSSEWDIIGKPMYSLFSTLSVKKKSAKSD